MICSGSLGVILVVSTLVTIVPPTLSRSVSVSLDPDELTRSIANAISHSLSQYNDRIAMQPDKAALLVAMTIHDLYGSNGYAYYDYDEPKWNTVVKWLQHCGVALQNVVFSPNLANIKPGYQFSVRNRSDSFGNFHSDIDQLDYQQVVMKWRYEMEQAEKAALKSGLYFSESKSGYKRKVELVVSILPKWEQLVLADFENTNPYKQLHTVGVHGHFDQPARNRFVWSLANVAATNKACFPNRSDPAANYYHQQLIIPEQMKHFVLSVNIPVETNSDGHLVMFYGDALEWIAHDYAHQLSATQSNPHKIVYYFPVIKQSKPVVPESNSTDAQCKDAIEYRNRVRRDAGNILWFLGISSAAAVFVLFSLVCIACCIETKPKNSKPK